jgi:excisionase family DNA binding protein
MIERTMSPAQVARIVGVSESTLKRWVDTGLLRAQKTAGGHRRISLAEALAFLRKQGREAPSLDALGLLGARVGGRPHTEVTPEALADLLLGEDLAVARALVLDEFRRGRAVDDLLDRLVGPAMARIGVRWAKSEIDVYQEHVATQRAWWTLVELRGLLPAPPAEAPLALTATPEGDPSLLPGLMAELTLVEAGWRALNLGPDLPALSLRAAVEAHHPRLVSISLTLHAPHPRFFEHYPRVLEAAGAAGTAVMLGGQGLTPEAQDRLVATAFGTRLAHLKAFAAALRRR